MESDKRTEITQILESIGYTKRKSFTLACLMTATEKLTSDEIEDITGLRQPDVSVAMNELLQEGVINYPELAEYEGRGRPHVLYSLKLTVPQLIQKIEDFHKQKHRIIRQKIETLRSLA